MKLDPLPWIEEDRRYSHWVGPYLPVGQLATEFSPREGFEQDQLKYPEDVRTPVSRKKLKLAR